MFDEPKAYESLSGPAKSTTWFGVIIYCGSCQEQGLPLLPSHQLLTTQAFM